MISPSRLAAVLGVGWLAVAGSIRAATVWVETGAKIDTVVADVATAPPANPLAPLAAPIPFKGFRYPHVDAAQNVTFIADDPVFTEGGAHHGIFRSYAGNAQLNTLVSQDALFPGSNRPFSLLRGLQMDERGVDFVFNATGEQDRGLFLWSGGVTTPVALANVTVLPGDAAPVTDVHWGALNNGRVLYVAQDAARRTALVLHEVKTGIARVLLRSGDPIPGHPGETFHDLAGQDWLDETSIVFHTGSVNPAAPEEDPKRRGVYGWFNIHWQDPAAFDPARLVTLADTADSVPGLAGQRFAEFYSAPVHAGLVGFEAESRGSKGVYFSEHGGAVHSVVDTETEITGLFAGKFTGFGIWPAAVDHGVVFTARAGKFTGVFFYRADQDALYLLADNRLPLEGKRIDAFEIGSLPMAGNRFALTALFTDETSGVYLATIPERAYKRMNRPSGSR